MSKWKRAIILGTLCLAVALSFWLISRYPQLNEKAISAGATGLDDTLTNRAHWPVPRDATLWIKILYTTANWVETNWRGMAFGVSLAAGFLTLLSYIPNRESTNRFVNALYGMLAGTPLGVCVNCVAPIAKGVREAGRRMELVLALMFSSPSLNIIVLTMLFSLFPFYMAVTKLAVTLVLILVFVPLLSPRNPAPVPVAGGGAIQGDPLAGNAWDSSSLGLVSESWGAALLGSAKDLLKNLLYIFRTTVPLMFLAGFLGAAVSHLVNLEQFIGEQVTLTKLAAISLIGTFLPLPIAFDMMLAQALSMSGLKAGFVGSLLFTLGSFSIYSAFVLYRTFSLGLAVKLYLLVSMLGIGMGWGIHNFSELKHSQFLQDFAASVSAPPPSWAPPGDSLLAYGELAVGVRSVESFHRGSEVAIERSDYASRSPARGPRPFTKLLGTELGIDYRHELNPITFIDPLFFGLGIASGDVNQDGWLDLVIATDHGVEYYQNVDGKRFQKVQIAPPAALGSKVVNVALIDLDNDGLLDIYYSTYGHGTWVVLHPETARSTGERIEIPNGGALLTNATAFGDVNVDGYLDLVNGNYFLGDLTHFPMENSRNQLVMNYALLFDSQDLPGIPGQTTSVLFSDINWDGKLDLLVGNDYEVSDTYYFGQGGGRFRKVSKTDGVIPAAPEHTMGIDSGDYDNDLALDLYFSNIGLSSNSPDSSAFELFSESNKAKGERFCEEQNQVLSPEKCQEMVKLLTLLSTTKQDPTESCRELGDPVVVQHCMVARMAIVAAKRREPALCENIPASYELTRRQCTGYFERGEVAFDESQEIGQQLYFNMLFRSAGRERFEDVSVSSHTAVGEWGWTARFADLDNDEWQDIYNVNGALVTQDFTANNFFHNKEGRFFQDEAEEFGLADFDHSSAYVYIDFDNDGDLDIITNTFYGPFKVYINNESDRSSIGFQLRDERGNRFCIGCKVFVHYGEGGERHQMRELKASGGYRSYDAARLHFGLGEWTSVNRVEVVWSDGERTEIRRDLPAGALYTLTRRGQDAPLAQLDGGVAVTPANGSDRTGPSARSDREPPVGAFALR